MIENNEIIENNEKYYFVEYKCCNCLVEEDITFVFGQEAPDLLTCDNCGVEKLVKVKK